MTVTVWRVLDPSTGRANGDGPGTATGALVTTSEQATAVMATGPLPVASDRGVDNAIAWVLGANDAREAARAGVPGWRLTVIHGENRAATTW